MFQLLLLLLVTPSIATTFQTEIAEVHLAPDASKPTLIFLMKDGLVAKLPSHQSKNLTTLTNGALNHQFFEITLNDDREITNIKPIGHTTHLAPIVPGAPDASFEKRLAPYRPTVLPNRQSATSIFNRMNPYSRNRSECYNRAHVWVYEEKNRSNFDSMKVFLFFTSKYIWEYNYDWWFHVSPFTYVTELAGNTEYVLDYVFMNGPTKMKNWTDYFITPKTECPTVAKYSDYRDHQQAAYCYLIKVSMYYWQPYNLENLENKGTEKTSFIRSEINHAYWQAF